MASFDTFKYPPVGRPLPDVHCDDPGQLSTRVVVPLRPAVSTNELKKRASSLAGQQDCIMKALDMISSGF